MMHYVFQKRYVEIYYALEEDILALRETFVLFPLESLTLFPDANNYRVPL